MSEHDHRITSALARAAARHGYQQESVTSHTPLDDLLDAEDAAQVGELERSAVLNRLLDYLAADGPHPGCVLRRYFAVVKALQREDLLCGMTLQELGLMFGETKAAQSWRVKKIFSGYLRGAGAKGFKARFQKSETARAAYARAQLGNTNRRGKKAA
jgi:hypothetical protein